MQHKKVSFYPCCNVDILESYKILSKLSDIVIYCDNSIYSLNYFNSIRSEVPKAVFINGDAIKTLKGIESIDIFFYRKDSAGEGGSGIFFFGDQYFSIIAEKLNKKGALIISDGSNARGKNWSKMKRINGCILYNRKFYLNHEQPYLDLDGNGPVYTIKCEALID